MEKYISILEFAAKANRSKQAIYKQVNNPNSQLAPYAKREGKQILIAISALEKVYGVESQPSQPEKPSNQGEKASEGLPQQSTQEVNLVNYLSTQIEELKAEKKQMEERYNAIIQEKDSLIAELAQSSATLAAKALTATTNQQTLAAMDKAPPQTLEEQTATTEPKKGFWKMLFTKPTKD